MSRWITEWSQAGRSLWRAPGHAATCMALLALGMASAMAVVALGHGLLKRPLPVRADERLIVPYGSRGDSKRLLASALDAEAWRRAPSFEGCAFAHPQAVTLDEAGEPERLRAARVEAGYFPLLGVAPIRGRGFDAAEARRESRVVVLGFGLWQRRFGGDERIVGSSLRVDGEEWTVVGVMPRGFDFPVGAQLWFPLDLATLPEGRRTSRIYDPVARLAPGRHLEDARAELAVIARRLESEHPNTHAGWGVRAISLRQNLLDDPDGTLERAVELTSWGGLLLLAIACANVAQLRLARAALRCGDAATRLALGASRGALARAEALEGCALAALAAVLSLPLAWALARAFLWLEPVSASAFSEHLLGLAVSPRIWGLAALATLASALLAGAYPALQAARADAAGLLGRNARGTVDPGQRRFLRGVVASQIAISFTLLSLTVALGDSYALLRRLDVGFEPAGVSYYELSLSPRDYADHERRVAFADALVGAVRQVEGVAAASYTTNVPLSSPSVNWVARYGCEGRVPRPSEELFAADRLVGPGHLEALGVRLLAGRTFDEREATSAERVAVISESLARECWPDGAGVGRRVLRHTRGGATPMRVVGVVSDPQEQRVSFGVPHASWYLPYPQHALQRDLYLVVRGDAAPEQVRAIVRRLDPHQPIAGPRRLAEHLDEVTGSGRLAALVSAYFALLGATLSGVGLRGALHGLVVGQQRAFAVRLALGGEPRRLARGVLSGGLRLSSIGILLGLAGALALDGVASRFVFGATLAAPARLSLVAAGLLLLALVACARPALRASRIDPARLLREA